MNIFIGTHDTASILAELAAGFRELGAETTSYVEHRSKFYRTTTYDIYQPYLLSKIFKYNYSTIIPHKIIKLVEWFDKIISFPYLLYKNKKIVDNNEVFIFIYKPWFKESYLFPKLKKKGKKIVCIHLGSDARHISAFEQEFKINTSSWERYYHTDSLDKKIKKIRTHELYADLIYSVPDQAGLLIAPYNHIFIPLSKDKKIVCNIPGKKVPLIIHAPSVSGIKGSEIIEAAIEKLQKDGIECTFRLVRNMPNKDLLELLSEADILVDELFLHGPGVLSLEAMKAGCAVATRCLMKPPLVPPLVAIDEHNLYDAIKNLILDIPYRIQLAKQGAAYVSSNNDSSTIAKNILSDIQNLNKVRDYYPQFFVNEYIPSKSISEKAKQLNRMVLKRFGKLTETTSASLKKRDLI